MFRSRTMRKIRALFLLIVLIAVLAFVGYWDEAIHPVHNFLSLYSGVSHVIGGMVASAHNGS